MERDGETYFARSWKAWATVSDVIARAVSRGMGFHMLMARLPWEGNGKRAEFDSRGSQGGGEAYLS